VAINWRSDADEDTAEDDALTVATAPLIDRGDCCNAVLLLLLLLLILPLEKTDDAEDGGRA